MMGKPPWWQRNGNNSCMCLDLRGSNMRGRYRSLQTSLQCTLKDRHENKELYKGHSPDKLSLMSEHILLESSTLKY